MVVLKNFRFMICWNDLLQHRFWKRFFRTGHCVLGKNRHDTSGFPYKMFPLWAKPWLGAIIQGFITMNPTNGFGNTCSRGRIRLPHSEIADIRAKCFFAHWIRVFCLFHNRSFLLADRHNEKVTIFVTATKLRYLRVFSSELVWAMMTFTWILCIMRLNIFDTPTRIQSLVEPFELSGDGTHVTRLVLGCSASEWWGVYPLKKRERKAQYERQRIHVVSMLNERSTTTTVSVDRRVYWPLRIIDCLSLSRKPKTWARQKTSMEGKNPRTITFDNQGGWLTWRFGNRNAQCWIRIWCWTSLTDH